MTRSKSLCANVCEKVCAELTAHLQSDVGSKKGLSGMAVFIQRFVSAANLNIQFRVIALESDYGKESTGRLMFYSAQSRSNETIKISWARFRLNNVKQRRWLHGGLETKP